jgi:hypothetical protein
MVKLNRCSKVLNCVKFHSSVCSSSSCSLRLYCIYCSSSLPTNTLNSQSCQNCKKLQKEHTSGPESCKYLSKKSSHLHKLKNSELVSTDQSDTDQEKDIIDECTQDNNDYLCLTMCVCRSGGSYVHMVIHKATPLLYTHPNK